MRRTYAWARHQSDSTLRRSECRWKKTQKIARFLRCTAPYSNAKFSQILEVPRDLHRLFGSRNSPVLPANEHIFYE